MKTGIDAISFYVPQLYVPMDTLANARGIQVEKLNKGLGLKKMAIPNIGEDAATFAANALLNLINQNNINPNEIGRVYLGTESAIDGSKPTATYAVEIVEKELAPHYGERCFKNCDILDMTFACVGGVDALHNSIDWIKQDITRKAVVIASDLSKYHMNSSGEYTQGAGAVAILVSHSPSIIELSDVWGVASKSEGDFFKPRRAYKKKDLLKAVFSDFNIDVTEDKMEAFMASTASEFWSDKNEIIEVFKEEPVFDGQFSNACYEDRITEALDHFKSQKSIDYLTDWQHIVFHLPYAFHGRRIIFNNWLNWIKNGNSILELENEIGGIKDLDKKEWNKKAYKSNMYNQFLESKIKSGELASSEIGNMYTASIFMALLSLLTDCYDRSEPIEGNKVGFISYGSGSKSKVFEGKIQPDWKAKVQQIKLFDYLKNRKAIDLETYENLHCSKLNHPVFDGSKISLDYTESDEVNYGLRRYSVK